MFKWYERSAECYAFLPDVHNAWVDAGVEATFHNGDHPIFESALHFISARFRTSFFKNYWLLLMYTVSTPASCASRPEVRIRA